MKDNKTYIHISRKWEECIFSLFAFSFLLLLVACKGNSPSGKKPKSNKPMQSITNATILRSENGIVQLQIKAPLINNYTQDSTRIEFPKGVRATFYNPNMSVKSLLIAGYAINYNRENKVYLGDSIIIINYNDKDTIFCHDIVWDRTQRMIYSSHTVKRVSAQGVSWGDSFVSNETMDSLRVINSRGTQIVKDQQ